MKMKIKAKSGSLKGFELRSTVYYQCALYQTTAIQFCYSILLQIIDLKLLIYIFSPVANNTCL